MGYFSRQEFRDGLSELGAITIAQLRKVLPRLPLEVQDSAALDEFHRFAFSFCLTVRLGAGGWRLAAWGGAATPAWSQPSSCLWSCV